MTDAMAVSYQQLKEEIARIFVEGHERARQAVERQRVQVCWEVGQLLDGHLLENEGRAGYGERVMARNWPKTSRSIGSDSTKWSRFFGRFQKSGRPDF